MFKESSLEFSSLNVLGRILQVGDTMVKTGTTRVVLYPKQQSKSRKSIIQQGGLPSSVASTTSEAHITNAYGDY